MTQEEAKKWLPLIAAKAEGKKIDMKFHGQWISNCHIPVYVGGGQNVEDFRIQKEPKLVPWTLATLPAQFIIVKNKSIINDHPKIIRFEYGAVEWTDGHGQFYSQKYIMDNYLWCHDIRGEWRLCGTYEEEV